MKIDTGVLGRGFCAEVSVPKFLRRSFGAEVYPSCGSLCVPVSYSVAPFRRPYWRMGFEHLRVYQASAALRQEVDAILREVSSRHSAITNHLDRAVESTKCNIAEGAPYHDGRRNLFYNVARGSVAEARSCLQSLVQRGAITAKLAYRAIGLTYAIQKMLTAMILRTADG